MKIEFKSSNLFYKTTVIFILGFILSSCIRFHHNKFGKEYNDTRIKIKLPIIKNEWTLKEIIALDGKKLQIGAKIKRLGLQMIEKKEILSPTMLIKPFIILGIRFLQNVTPI